LFVHIKSRIPFLLLPLALLLVGCGKKPNEVKGTVTFADGQPVPLAKIFFVGAEGKTSPTFEVRDGEFIATGVPEGDQVKVVVSTKAVLHSLEQTVQQLAPRDVSNDTGSRMKDKPPPDVKMTPEMEKRLYGHLPEEARGRAQEAKEQLEEMKKKLVPVDEKYEKDTSTPLAYKITAGPQTIEIKVDRGK
jgi:hypothetical protein